MTTPTPTLRRLSRGAWWRQFAYTAATKAMIAWVYLGGAVIALWLVLSILLVPLMLADILNVAGTVFRMWLVAAVVYFFGAVALFIVGLFISALMPVAERDAVTGADMPRSRGAA